MKTIKVIAGGCGIKYTKNGTTRHELKTAQDKPFQCEDAQADRLVRLGVARYVDTAVIETQDNAADEQKGAMPDVVTVPDVDTADATNQEPEKLTGHLDAADLETWDFNEIRKLAADMGVKPEGKKKADYIAAIVAVEVEVDPDVVDDPDNELPDLSVVLPE